MLVHCTLTWLSTDPVMPVVASSVPEKRSTTDPPLGMSSLAPSVVCNTPLTMTKSPPVRVAPPYSVTPNICAPDSSDGNTFCTVTSKAFTSVAAVPLPIVTV
ncbi:hypothetical protein D3C71_1939330 [compost metagenome]